MGIVLDEKRYERARKRLGITHAETCRRAGISYATLRSWFTGKRSPNSKNQQALAHALETEPAKLFRIE